MKFEANSQYYEKNPFNKDDINIFFGSYEINLSDKLGFPAPYTTDYYTLNICTKGGYNIYANGRKFTINENTLHITFPYMQIRKEFFPSPSKAMYITVKGAALKPYFEALGINEENILFPHPVSDDQIKLFEEIINTLSTYTKAYYDMDSNPQITSFRNSQDATARRMHRRGLFYLLLAKLFKLHKENTRQSLPPTSSKLYIKKATEYIEENYSSDISVNEIANHLGFNRSYLYKLFKKELGISVQDFITQTKIRISCSLLKHTDLSIKLIAISINYNSIAYSRAFKKYIGMTPTQYRKTNHHY